MTAIDLVLFVLILGAGVLAFACFILLGTRFASPRRLGFCLIVMGAAMLTALGRYQLQLALLGERSTGVVERLERVRGGTRPTVRFPTADGQEIDFRCKHGVGATTYQVGQEVEVYYLADHPHFAVVATWQSLWLPLAIGAFVSCLPVVGGALLVRGRKLGGPRSASIRDRSSDPSPDFSRLGGWEWGPGKIRRIRGPLSKHAQLLVKTHLLDPVTLPNRHRPRSPTRWGKRGQRRRSLLCARPA